MVRLLLFFCFAGTLAVSGQQTSGGLPSVAAGHELTGTATTATTALHSVWSGASGRQHQLSLVQQQQQEQLQQAKAMMEVANKVSEAAHQLASTALATLDTAQQQMDLIAEGQAGALSAKDADSPFEFGKKKEKKGGSQEGTCAAITDSCGGYVQDENGEMIASDASNGKPCGLSPDDESGDMNSCRCLYGACVDAAQYAFLVQEYESMWREREEI
ncbi:unnamed protein product [Vitrella brassicaformis CCMP3155]|uniref:Uncharacterized protein n=2 Tax=Vitrella brassicaformis TaxID=1169539 RepID=A0A0G4G5M8_VITBC|nr:unnamed protein product [Vitrella brassicaformis CCMP3155]|eukprot:CEM23773.1 unnamed protein product [Vitrella brassicaformis CCMP3155]